MSLSTRRLIRYGVLGALCVVVVGGAVYLFGHSETAIPATTADRATPRSAAKPVVHADEQPVPSAAQSDQAARLIGEARRLAADGMFSEANAALDQAEKVVPHLPETAQARSDIAAMNTPQGQLALQLDRARAAIGQDDRAAAERALAEAERLNPQAPEIAPLRQALQAAEQKDAQRSSRIAELLAAMRTAIARHDFAAADGALNEAARTELAHAQEAERKAKAEK